MLVMLVNTKLGVVTVALDTHLIVSNQTFRTDRFIRHTKRDRDRLRHITNQTYLMIKCYFFLSKNRMIHIDIEMPQSIESLRKSEIIDCKIYRFFANCYV